MIYRMGRVSGAKYVGQKSPDYTKYNLDTFAGAVRYASKVREGGNFKNVLVVPQANGLYRVNCYK